jgi:hypothetical protein
LDAWGAAVKRIVVLLLLLLMGPMAWGHVGSKDVFETVHAGPYVLYVTVRPPNVIPGVATVEVRSSGARVTGIRITPLPLTGEAAKHPPAADTMKVSSADASFYTGAVWMMASGTWQVKIDVDGEAGARTASVPVLAVPIATLKMQTGMGVGLGLMGVFLVLSMGGVVAASVREARLRPGQEPTTAQRAGGMIAMGISVAVMGVLVLLGGKWWNVEVADYAENVFTPAKTEAVLSGNQLDLRVETFRAESLRRVRSNSDYLPDHGKLMHLFAIREPGMDAVFHLHPVLAGAGDFRMILPAMPPGRYRLYGDVVHATGFPETLLASVDIPAGIPEGRLEADDASALPAAVQQGELGRIYRLPDGYTMRWDGPESLTAGTAYNFRFTLLNPQGKPAEGMEPYLGMAGHAAFVKTDGTVFAHTHPEGSAAMPDVLLAGQMEMTDVGPSVEFPYGFPSAGQYRVIAQMKHAGVVESGVFDAVVK